MKRLFLSILISILCGGVIIAQQVITSPVEVDHDIWEKFYQYFLEPKTLLGLALFIFCLCGIIYTHWKREEEIWAGIKGEDKILQIPEYIIWIWIKLYPPVILGDLFLDFELGNNGWWSLNLIMLFALLGKAAVMRYLKIKENDQPKEKSDEAV